MLMNEPGELKELEETIQRSVDRVFGGVSAIQKQTVNGKINEVFTSFFLIRQACNKMIPHCIPFQSCVDFPARLRVVISNQMLVLLSN